VLADLATLTVCCAASAVILCTRTGREHLWRWTRDILLSLRFVLWEKPLRSITGRRRPDYARIKILQRGVDVPLADLIGNAEREAAGGGWHVKGLCQIAGKCYQDGQEISAAEYEHAPLLSHGTKTSGVRFANAEIAAASALVSAGYDPADVLAAVRPEHGYRGAMDYWTQEAAAAGEGLEP
jgi:hypothetical protein